jgi:hypothetical protein
MKKLKTTYVYQFTATDGLIYEANFNSHSEAENKFSNAPEYVDPHFYKVIITA